MVCSAKIKLFSPYTSRQRAELLAAPSYDYGCQVPSMLLVLLLGLVYSVVSPLVAPFALLYFIVGLVVTKQQLLFVCEKVSQ